MTRLQQILAQGRRFIKQIAGKDLWTRPEIQVPSERLGSSYGGWTVRTNAGLNPDSIVYSFGVGRDISFDLSLIGRFGCHVIAFDPTPASRAWIETLPPYPRLTFVSWGLAAKDGILAFEPPEKTGGASFRVAEKSRTTIDCPVYRLSSIMEKLGHTRIDLLKMDIEGSEYGVISDIADGAIRPGQLLVEFHHGMHGMSVDATRASLAELRQMKYRVFSISPTGREYSLCYLGDSRREDGQV